MNSPATSATGLRAYRLAIVACFVFQQEISRKAVWDFFDSSVVAMASSIQVLFLFALARHEPGAFGALPAGLSALFLGSRKMWRDPGAFGLLKE
jgi:hypothetical protein